MLDKFKLDNLTIRNKLILLLAVPVLALLLYAFIGYGERDATARRAADDEKLFQAAAATADLVTALEYEMNLVVAKAGGGEVDEGLFDKTTKATDAAIAQFQKRSEALDLTPNSPAADDLQRAKTDLVSLQRYRDNPVEPKDTEKDTAWLPQFNAYMSQAISNLVEYGSDLATETTTPAVRLPISVLNAVVDYNLETSALAIMALHTQGLNGDAPPWHVDRRTTSQEASDGSTDSSTKDLQQEVYGQLNRQRASANLLDRIMDPDTKGSYNEASLRADALQPAFLKWQIQVRPDLDAQNGMTEEGLNPPDGSPELHLSDVVAQIDKLATASSSLIARTTNTIERERSSAESAARFYLLGGAFVIIIAIGAAVWISRSFTRRLDKLTGAADRLSHEQLPRLVDSLKNPAEEDVGYLASSFSAIDVVGDDEIGQLARAFNGIQNVAVDVATEQAQLLRKGIGDMFINLARRNQGLLDRQIEFIDELESAEEDPDQLENLFRLDHLATRMRRNAESLLVLAGAEPTRRRGKPVPLADVVRAAVGEVEDFARIDMLQFDEVLVASNAALDIAHLLSELMENATNFSPPDTRVEVVGHRTKAEGYVISVSDHGIGMSPEAFAEANDLLARPPLVGLAMSRSLGFIVIGRLAARFGIAVRLMPSPSSGTTAMVSLPPALITDQPRSSTEPHELVERGKAQPPPATDDTDALTTGTDRRPPLRRITAPEEPAEEQPEARKPAQRPRRSPAGPRTSAGIPKRTPGAGGAGDGSGPPRRIPRRTPGGPGGAEPAAAGTGATAGASVDAPAPDATATAPDVQATTGGLTKRVPRRAGGQRAVPGGDGSRTVTQKRRSPEEVRSMLSRYRSGMQKGRSDDEAPTKPEDDAE